MCVSECILGEFTCVCGGRTGNVSHPADVDQEVIKEFPHVVAGVDLLHLHLGVNIAVVQEVDVGYFHL